MHDEVQDNLRKAARAIVHADALLIGAGAGMGVDSGLPDFRGNQGFWKAYPHLMGRSFTEISRPHWFATEPDFAWGFFGHRLNLYCYTKPHAGFELLHRWAQLPPGGCFVFTSNVDGHFQKAGFSSERVVECHGSIHFLQCQLGCSRTIWTVEGITIDVDPATFRARSDLPRCSLCGTIARPNILMFGDGQWLPERSEEQQMRYTRWLAQNSGSNLVAIEIGAGTAIPTVRWECERRARTLIRINPRDAQTDSEGIAIPLGALEALERIDRFLTSKTFD